MKEIVLVTGSSGLIGYRAAERLDEPFEVVGFDREGPPAPFPRSARVGTRPPATECVAVDLTSEESVRHGLEGVRERHGERIASVIHLAAYYSFSGEPSHLVDALVLLTQRRAELPPELTLLLGETETLSYGELQQDLGRLIHGNLLSIPLGPVREAYGSWDRCVIWPAARGHAPSPRRRRGPAAG